MIKIMVENITNSEKDAVVINPTEIGCSFWRWVTLGVVVIATFMAILDSFIVNVAIPTIRQGLKASLSEVEFVIAGYTLAYAVGLITGGRLGDIYGRKWMFIIGMVGFVVTSTCCGIASQVSFLIMARILQGLAAALMIPQVLSIIQVTFSGEERSKALGIYSATIGLASIVGQLLGGFLVELDLGGLGWRSVFLVNVPVGLLAVVLATVFVRESKSPQDHKLDLSGVALVSAGLLLLAYPLVEGREAHWPLWMVVVLSGCVPVLAFFLLFEQRLAKRGAAPLINLLLFKNRAFVIGLTTVLVFYSGNAAFNFLLAFFLQNGLGFGAFEAGSTFLPLGLGFLLASLFGRKLTPYLGRKVLVLGAILMATGYSMVIVILNSNTYILLSLKGYFLSPALLIEGLGQGLVSAPLINIILTGVASEAIGSASGMLSTANQLAQALGVALIGNIFFGLLPIQQPTELPKLTTTTASQLVAQAYANTFGISLGFLISLALATLLLTIFLAKH